MFAGAVTDSLDWFAGLVAKALVMVLMLVSFYVGGGLATGQVRLSDLNVTGVRRVLVHTGEVMTGVTRRQALKKAMTVTESPFEVANSK